MARRVQNVCQKAIGFLDDPSENAHGVADWLAQSLTDTRKEPTMTAAEVLPAAMERLWREGGDAISTGIAELDHITDGGMRAKELWVIGSQPSGGKSSLCRQIERAVLTQGVGVHSHSIEVPKEDWVLFNVAHLAQIEAWRLRRAWKMNTMEKERMTKAARKVHEWPHVIDDSGSVHINQLIARSRQSRIKHGTLVHTIDYLQMIDGDQREERHKITHICKSLKQFSKDQNCTVILLSQMARQGDINARPTMQHLKESGGIEAAADVILLNYRPKDTQTETYTGEDEVIIAKQRNGAIGKMEMVYNPNTLTFDRRTQ